MLRGITDEELKKLGDDLTKATVLARPGSMVPTKENRRERCAKRIAYRWLMSGQRPNHGQPGFWRILDAINAEQWLKANAMIVAFGIVNAELWDN